MKLAVCGCLAALCLAASGCGSAGEKSSREGAEAYARQDWERAAALFRQAITQDRKEPQYYVSLGLTMLEQGDTESAKDQFDQALSLSPRNAQALRGMGLCSLMEGEYGQADEFLTQSLELFSRKSEAWCDALAYRAEARKQSGDIPGAVDDCRTLAETGYEPEAMFLSIGNLLLQEDPGNPSEAMRYYQEAVRTGFRNYDLWLSILGNLKAAGCEAEYRLVLEKALLMDAETEADRCGRGLLYLEDGQIREAFSEFERSFNMGYAPAGYWLGCCYELEGDYEEAALVYEKLLLTEPESAKIYNQLAVCRIRQERNREALRLIGQGLEYADASWEKVLTWNRAVCYERLHEYGNAEAAFRTYSALCPGDPEAEAELTYLSSR